MRTLALLVVLALSAAGEAAPKPAGPEPADIGGEVKTKLKFVSDGKGHFLAFVPFGGMDSPIFYGDGKTFWQLRVFGGGSSGDGSKPDDNFDMIFWEPRVTASWRGGFGYRKQKYEVQCQDRKTELKPVDDAEAAKLIDAKFYKPRWTRRAYALARDNNGIYYYVDILNSDGAKSDFHLYAGPKGALKLQKMTNIVSDSEGDIFATKTGSLRLVLNKGESLWQAGAKKEKLVFLPLDANHVLIYTDLGVYSGLPLGTPCDDL